MNNDFDYDIAVMQLDRDLEFNRKVQPACLPPVNIKQDFTSSLNCFISGWGETDQSAGMVLRNYESGGIITMFLFS